MPAHPVELPVGQHAQQPGLGFGWHVADLVEEQRATVGLFEAPAALRGGAGEGAFLMAEQLGFHQVLGNRRHVQRDERLRSARAVAVQGMRNQFLAGTRLAIDQHRDVGVAETADGAEHLLHRWRLADDLWRARLVQRDFQALLFLRVLVGTLD
ncbi:MAG: hypothetical protein GAK45_01258 [Pseudomonas citronellolis]|nr:MAG: hypothetical protein GAK45_01258 [Pseudomonas citronellolis]